MESEKTHLTTEEIEKYHQRTLTVASRQRFDRHVASCEDCLERALGSKDSRLAFTKLMEAFTSSREEPFHLSTKDLKRYAAGQLDEADKTIFESHLEDCSECRTAHANVIKAAERKSTITTPAHEHASLWQRFIPPWDWSVFLAPGRLAGATTLAAFVLVASVLTLWLAGRYWRGPDLTRQTGPTSTQKTPTATTVRLKDGPGEITINEKGSVAGLEWLAPKNKKAVQEALMTAQMSKPQVLVDLATPEIKLMGESARRSPFALSSPVGTVVTEDRPTLRWQALSGASSYVVSVFDSEFRNVAKSTPEHATEWRVPSALHRGSTYFWQVTAQRGDQQITVPVPPSPRAQFRVLDRQTMNALEQAKAQQPSSHLALGVLYARAGLLSDSEREFQALVNENPESPVASRLLHSVQAWKHK